MLALSDDHLLPPPFDDFDFPPLVFPPLPLFEDGGGLFVLDLALLLVKMGLVGPLVVGTGMSEDTGGIVGTVTMGDAEGVRVGSSVRSVRLQVVQGRKQAMLHRGQIPGCHLHMNLKEEEVER